jgi:hypothetical protein
MFAVPDVESDVEDPYAIQRGPSGSETVSGTFRYLMFVKFESWLDCIVKLADVAAPLVVKSVAAPFEFG